MPSVKFEIFFTVEIRHAYFDNRLCSPLKLNPVNETRTLMDNTGMLFKPEGGRIVVFYDTTRLDTMKMYMDDPFDPFCFYFTGQISDHVFFNYTENIEGPPETALFMNTRSGNPEPCCLTRTSHVSIKDHTAASDPVLATAMTGSIKRLSPLCIIGLFPDPDAGILFSKQGQVLGQTFYATFPTRKTRWKYLILGKPDPVQVVDRDQKIRFEKTEPPDLPVNSPAQAFISDQPIPLSQNCRTNFALKDEMSGALIIKRLPPASPNTLFKSKNPGTAGYISEIFINI
jgi:hypothetical protein